MRWKLAWATYQKPCLKKKKKKKKKKEKNAGEMAQRVRALTALLKVEPPIMRPDALF
jgi:hypothetical protein